MVFQLDLQMLPTEGKLCTSVMLALHFLLVNQLKRFPVSLMEGGRRNQHAWVKSVKICSCMQITYCLSSLASQCVALPEVPHANVTILNGLGRSYGTIVRFECEPGYIRSGHPVILCMSNGTWSGDVPTCTSKRFK